MYTYLGIDNVQKAQLSLVCKSFEETGEIKLLWTQKLRGESEIASFFSRLPGRHWPLTYATTCVTHDPCDILADHVRRGGILLRYYPWELPGQLHPLSRSYQRANLLAVQAVTDQHYPVTVRALQRQLSQLRHQIFDVLRETTDIDKKFDWLSTCLGLNPVEDQIPF